MKIKTKTLVLTTVGAFALSYAIIGSNAFADTTPTPTSTTPAAAPTTAPTTPLSITPPVVPPIQAPAGLASPSAGANQDDDGDVNEQSDDANDDGDINESGDNEDGLSIDLTTSLNSSDGNNVDGNQSGDHQDGSDSND